MNLKNIHPEEKTLSLKTIFKAEDGQLISLKMKFDEVMKEHITHNMAMLICLEGEVVYSEHTGLSRTLHEGDFVEIPRMVPHKLKALQDSELLLFK